jgi:hypothetical protein
VQPADPVVLVVHAAAGGLLHDRLQRLALDEQPGDRRVGGAEEQQVVEHPVELGEQRPQPHGAVGHLHAEHPLDGQHDAQLVGERRQPVVAVGEHHRLAVVADLEELLGAAVQEADDGSAETTTSPSRTSASCRTPCVDGWCGPSARTDVRHRREAAPSRRPARGAPRPRSLGGAAEKGSGRRPADQPPERPELRRSSSSAAPLAACSAPR